MIGGENGCSLDCVLDLSAIQRALAEFLHQLSIHDVILAALQTSFLQECLPQTRAGLHVERVVT